MDGDKREHDSFQFKVLIEGVVNGEKHLGDILKVKTLHNSLPVNHTPFTK